MTIRPLGKFELMSYLLGVMENTMKPAGYDDPNIQRVVAECLLESGYLVNQRQPMTQILLFYGGEVTRDGIDSLIMSAWATGLQMGRELEIMYFDSLLKQANYDGKAIRETYGNSTAGTATPEAGGDVRPDAQS